MQKKTIIRKDVDNVFRIIYLKGRTRISKNVKYFTLNIGRDIKIKLRDRILTDKTFDAYEYK